MRKDSNRGITLMWFGGHGIHGYKNKKEIAFWNVGNFSKDEATREEIIKSMQKVIKEGNYADYEV